MQRNKKLGIVALLISILCVSIVVAVIFNTKPITNNVTITGIYEFTLYEDEAKTIELTTIEWGEVCKNDESHTTLIYVKNTGNEPFGLSWSCTDLPTGLTLSLQIGATEWLEDVIFPSIPTGVSYTIELSLTASDTATLGTTSFTTVFEGHEG